MLCGDLNGKEIQGRGYLCVHVADSFCHIAETIQSMKFSRPEYWSGLAFHFQGIFPIQGSNPGLPHCRQILYQLSHKQSPRILEWVALPFSKGSSQPRTPTLQVDSLPAEPQGKPKNTRVGSLSLLQQIFQTQELNQGLLHFRQFFTK